MQFLEFTFYNFWHFAGVILLIHMAGELTSGIFNLIAYLIKPKK